ncbi:type II secretion system minor pseudopilin GspH [Psychrosphaera haliotis]|uniref:Type II secretion system protein H n=1 Tax=Psychrosphaera haliotis TaxID=555083 RepID=A0A6N8FGP8_9GAMM|nr:type II secretion system minor pseudopilin GspH [Psychrosphaera haliotis]MUH73431.1 type II secretion system protein GspH [Psychrosphaera haliotis]
MARCSKHQGFTLIELMLVIVIIGYLVSLVRFPSFAPNAYDLVEEESQKLTALINLASEYATVKNKQLGLSVSEQQYVFLILEDEEWVRFTDRPFETEPLNENLTLTLKLDGLPWQEQSLLSAVQFIDDETMEDQSGLSNEEKLLAFPQVFLLSSGEISPFEIELEFQDFDDVVMFVIQGLFTAPVKHYNPAEQEELDR